MLCRWSLAIQEYDFTIVYHKGSSNSNADALSRLPPLLCAVTISLPHTSDKDLRDSESKDSILSTILQAYLTSPDAPHSTIWKKPPFYRYKQIWHQLKVIPILTQSNVSDGHGTHFTLQSPERCPHLQS